MFVSYKLNISKLDTTLTSTTFNLPISLNYQIVDNSDVVEDVFVKSEIKKAINPILDYDKVKYKPVDIHEAPVNIINYNLYFLNDMNIMTIPSFYSTIGFDSNDILFSRNNFKNSFLSLEFYSTDNPLTQQLITYLDVYTMIKKEYYGRDNRPKLSSQIPVNFSLSNTLNLNNTGFFEGYNIYSYKDIVTDNLPTFLYMKAVFNNAKTGKRTNLSTVPDAHPINTLITKLYTRYRLIKSTNNYYYTIDTDYSDNVEFILTSNNYDVNVNLYQIQSL